LTLLLLLLFRKFNLLLPKFLLLELALLLG